ncbi:MAG: GNAT family N-acetyltransferase [Bryobacteraceae bacterium]
MQSTILCSGSILVRDAREADTASIQKIYAHYVLNGVATFEEVPPTLDDICSRREIIQGAGLPYLVAEVQQHIVGYVYATVYRPRPAYRQTVEDSVYVAEEFQSKGVGRALLSTVIERCEAGDWRQMIAVIGGGDNMGSIALHSRLGFQEVGTLKAVGFKLGQWVDTVLMQRALGRGDRTIPVTDLDHQPKCLLSRAS